MGESFNRFIGNLTNHDSIGKDLKLVFWECFSTFTTSTTVINKLVKRNNVPEALGNTIRIQELTIISPNGFLTEVFDEGDEAHIQKAVAFIDMLWSENKSARQVDGGVTGNMRNILERRLADRSKQTTSLLVPPIVFIQRNASRRRRCLRWWTDRNRPADHDGRFNIYKSIQPTELWNAESSTSRTSATMRRTGWG